MPASLSLSGPLAQLRKHGCPHCSPPEAGAAPTEPSVEADLKSGPHVFRQRWEGLSKPRCKQCEMLLLLQAIDRLVPVEEIDDWLKETSVDLSGRTPAECIDAGDYEPVFMALFLLHPHGPVS